MSNSKILSACLPVILLALLTSSLLLIGYFSGHTLIACLTLAYFYYSVFTLWHEIVHLPAEIRRIGLVTVLGEIAISPLMLFDFKSKQKTHLLHHSFTNNPEKDPDFNANNLIFKHTNSTKVYHTSPVSSRPNFSSLISKFIVISFLCAWAHKFGFITMLIAMFISYLFSHFIINIYPHFRANSLSRDLGGPRILTLLLLGNNFHGLHHQKPHLPWTTFLKYDQSY